MFAEHASIFVSYKKITQEPNSSKPDILKTIPIKSKRIILDTPFDFWEPVYNHTDETIQSNCDRMIFFLNTTPTKYLAVEKKIVINHKHKTYCVSGIKLQIEQNNVLENVKL